MTNTNRDSRWRRPGAVCMFVLFLGARAIASEAAPKVLGLELMPWSEKVDERRYKSTRNFEETIDYFRKKFKGSKQIEWRNTVSLVGVKYAHIENQNSDSLWVGANIYEIRGKGVFTYVLARSTAK